MGKKQAHKIVKRGGTHVPQKGGKGEEGGEENPRNEEKEKTVQQEVLSDETDRSE